MFSALGKREKAESAVVYTSRLFGGRRGNKVRYCCSTRDRRLPACWEANPGAGVCNTEVIMAVNLDKEAYYRRIKRLYSNWKVNFCRIAQCVWTCTRTSAVESRKFEGREAEAKLAAVSIQRVVGFCCRREKRRCSTNPPSSAWKRETGLHLQFDPFLNWDTFTPYIAQEMFRQCVFTPPKYRAMLTHVSTSPR